MKTLHSYSYWMASNPILQYKMYRFEPAKAAFPLLCLQDSWTSFKTICTGSLCKEADFLSKSQSGKIINDTYYVWNEDE